MGSLLHPVGALPPGAYWVRRVVVLVVVLLLVVGAWLALSGGGGGKSNAGPTASTTPHTTPSSTPVTTPSPSVTTTPSVSHTPTASATPALTACADSAIRVTALTDASSYAAGAKPHLTVSVTNTGKVACKRDIGRAAMGLLVASGSARTWSSDDCAPGGQAAVNTLKPGQVFSSTVIWNRTTSKAGCPTGQPAAAAGTYTLTARNGTLKSTPVTFVLH